MALALGVLLLVAATMLVNSPRVQQRVSVVLASELENRLCTRVSLGGVHWLFPNDIVIDSLEIDDQEGEHMLSVDRIAAKVEWMPLLKKGELSIRNIRLFNPNIHLYKPDTTSAYNHQFLLEAFAAKEKKEKQPSRLSLRVNSLLIRHANFKHHIGPTTEENGQKFNINDLAIKNLSAQLSLKTLSADSISVSMRHLEFREKSGLQLNDLYFRLVGNHHGATLANFRLDMPHTTLRLDTLWAAYSPERFNESLVVKGGVLPSSHITPCDFSSLLPTLSGITEKIHLDADFIGSLSRVNLKKINLYTHGNDIRIKANALADFREWRKKGNVDLSLHEAALTAQAWHLLSEQAPHLYEQIPEEVVRIGSIEVKGNAHLDNQQGNIMLEAKTDAGNIKSHMSIDHEGNYVIDLEGNELGIAQIIPTSPLTRTNLMAQAQGLYEKRRGKDILPLRGTLSIEATQTQLKGYEYAAIRLDGVYSPDSCKGHIILDDPCGKVHLQAKYSESLRGISRYAFNVRADSLNLHAMNLIDIHEDKTFSASMNGDLRGVDLDHMMGKICIDSLTMHREGDDYIIKEIDLYATDPMKKMLSLHSDFMDGTVRGEFSYQSLASSIQSRLHDNLPLLCNSHTHDHSLQGNMCYANLKIYNTQPLQELLLMPIEMTKMASIEASLNDHTEDFSFVASVPQVVYAENTFRGLNINCYSEPNQLILQAEGGFHDEEGIDLAANLIASMHNDSIRLGMMWNSSPAEMFGGTFYATAELDRSKQGELMIAIESDSSKAVIKGSEWSLPPFCVNIAPTEIAVHDFHFAHDSSQYLDINGAIAETSTDTLQVELNNLDLGYLLSFVKLEGISFGGNVSGHVDMANLYDSQPYLDANIHAQDFTFCDGPLGNLEAHAYWNQETERLEFTADAAETPRHTTCIDGIVDLRKNELWLDIAADSTNVAFLNKMLGSFMGNIKGNASGHLTVGGPLNAIDLNGSLLADVGFTLTPTNADYRFRDSLRFTPGVIRFDGIEAFDSRNQKAIIAGAVTHEKLSRYAYDLYVDVQNVLGIDLPDTGNDNFYTTIYGTGEVHVQGGPTMPLTIDIQAQPEKGSLFALNLASQTVSSSEAFITFTDRGSKRNVVTVVPGSANQRRRQRRPTEESSSMNLNIRAHVTPDATLKLVMNQAADDHISVSGSGDLQINVKDDNISLFGTYAVNRGAYRLSLQDVINKNFDVLNGSSVSFEGDPMAARLDITARHIVNYVPLKDLSPDMTGNVHVNCLLHIGGTLDAPTIAFNLELPQGTEEEKSVLRSYTSTEEQMNMQFIYLLGLGKFYTPDMAQNAQATGNMESFISSTISGQINNLLSNIISNDNWNIASNIRAENMMTGANDLTGDNWENMEIEGILEGRLLDNRLLINGNFGYRENPMYATNFIGDFDIRYMLTNSLSLKGYNKTNDRYFSKTSLTTQGVGLLFQRDFDRLRPRRTRRRPVSEPTDSLSVNKH